MHRRTLGDGEPENKGWITKSRTDPVLDEVARILLKYVKGLADRTVSAVQVRLGRARHQEGWSHKCAFLMEVLSIDKIES